MPRREALAFKEWYHIYNRAIDKKTIFHNDKDFERFYLTILQLKQEKFKHVKILAYAIMPNHFHFLIKAEHKLDSGVKACRAS